jgi:hypothetical protein
MEFTTIDEPELGLVENSKLMQNKIFERNGQKSSLEICKKIIK